MPAEAVNPITINKQADTDANVHELIRNRWSPRAFSTRPVSNEDLEAMLEAARWAASSSNEQPWRFFIARKSDAAAHARFVDILVAGNRVWASSAPVIIFMAAKRTFTKNASPNYYALHDAGQALAHLMLQATALGLHAHAMAGFDHERARKEIGIPDDYDIGAALAIGYLGDPDQLPEHSRKSELAKRERKPLREIAFGPQWNEPLAL
ncbi:MAG: nitroreductase family protein [Acidobacteriaceae bacterium]|nr:nitroreductase family protein [Acidobacteriaceae bacterium]